MADETGDAKSTPSYPYNGDFEQPTSKESSLTLASSTTTVNKGDSFSISLNADSKGNDIKSINVKITFDTTTSEVVDFDTNQVGTQIEVTNTSFTVSKNEVDMVNGTINLELTSTTAQSVSGGIASVEMTSIESGNASLEIIKAESNITDSEDKNILTSVQGTSVEIVSQDAVIPPTQPDDNTDSNLPNTAAFGMPFAGVLGVIFVVVSFLSIFKQRKKNAS